MFKPLFNPPLPNMVITIFGNAVFSPSIPTSAEEVFLLKNSHHKKKVRRLSILFIKTKITSVSIITTIATSNRCELDSLENLFSIESLKPDAFHFSERRTTLVPFNNLTDQSSRITKKNQFIERIAGIVLKRISRSKEFIPYSLFEASKARDTGSSRCPTITLSI